jgi:hypothetical protein
MFNSFQAVPDLPPYHALPANESILEKNLAEALGTEIKMNFDREDAAVDFSLNEGVWRSVRGSDHPMPPTPIRAAFVFPHQAKEVDRDLIPRS